MTMNKSTQILWPLQCNDEPMVRERLDRVLLDIRFFFFCSCPSATHGLMLVYNKWLPGQLVDVKDTMRIAGLHEDVLREKEKNKGEGGTDWMQQLSMGSRFAIGRGLVLDSKLGSPRPWSPDIPPGLRRESKLGIGIRQQEYALASASPSSSQPAQSTTDGNPANGKRFQSHGPEEPRKSRFR
ncbi:hypothetical protein LX36DRAFT_656190 [Colletotrichum falcatum]|nr:hypothetical protein LX36DRAFT_656190 [Colletotrichum falcatum]